MSTMASQITGVSIVFSAVSSGTDQRKLRGPVNSPTKGQWHRKYFHLMTSSCTCEHHNCRFQWCTGAISCDVSQRNVRTSKSRSSFVLIPRDWPFVQFILFIIVTSVIHITIHSTHHIIHTLPRAYLSLLNHCMYLVGLHRQEIRRHTLHFNLFQISKFKTHEWVIVYSIMTHFNVQEGKVQTRTTIQCQLQAKSTHVQHMIWHSLFLSSHLNYAEYLSVNPKHLLCILKHASTHIS